MLIQVLYTAIFVLAFYFFFKKILHPSIMKIWFSEDVLEAKERRLRERKTTLGRLTNLFRDSKKVKEMAAQENQMNQEVDEAIGGDAKENA